MTISAPPTPPQRTDSQEVFDAQGNALMSWLPTGVAEMNALETNVNAKEASAVAAAFTATTKAAEAEANVAIAVAATGAVVWVSGTTYALYATVISPLDFQTYRRKVAGGGTTDPSADPDNWVALNALPYSRDLVVDVDSTITLASSVGSSVASSCVIVDSTHDLLFLYGPSSCHAVVYDKTAKTFGAPALVRSASIATVSSILVSAGKVLVCTLPQSTTSLESVVLSISGSTIAVGTSVATTLASNSVIYKDADRIFSVGSTFILEYSNGAANSCFRGITVSGTTPTLGAEFVVSSGFYGGPAAVISSSLFLSVTASNSTLYAVPVSVSGTTLTAGTQATTACSAYQGTTMAALTSGRWALVYRNTTLYGAIVSVSGTTATISAVNLTLSVSSATDIGLFAVSSQAIVASSDGVNVLTDNSGSAVAGVAITSGVGPMFGYASSSAYVYVGTAASAGGRFSEISISGNNPVISKKHIFNYFPDATTATTYSNFGQMQQRNGGVGLATLRTNGGKHVGVSVSYAYFLNLITSGESPTRCLHYACPAICKPSNFEAYGFSLDAGNKIKIRRLTLS